MSRIVWSADEGWHDGPEVTVELNEGKLKVTPEAYLYEDQENAVFVVREFTQTAYLPSQGNRAIYVETIFDNTLEAQAYLNRIKERK